MKCNRPWPCIGFDIIDRKRDKTGNLGPIYLSQILHFPIFYAPFTRGDRLQKNRGDNRASFKGETHRFAIRPEAFEATPFTRGTSLVQIGFGRQHGKMPCYPLFF